MNSLLPKRAGYVCKSCRSALRAHLLARSYASATKRSTSFQDQINKRRPDTFKSQKTIPPSNEHAFREPIAPSKLGSKAPATFRESDLDSVTVVPQGDRILPSTAPIASSDPKGVLIGIQKDALEVLSSDRIPDEAEILSIMDRSYRLANLLIFSQSQTQQERRSEKHNEHKSNDVLSDLDEPLPEQQAQEDALSSVAITRREAAARSLCETLYTLLEDPKVFLSEALLSAYVRTICLLGCPEYIPKIFHLYAHKPIPKPNTYPIRYREPWSRMPKYAIPRPLTELALDAAIARKDMPLCIAIIDTTVATDQYKADRFMRKGLLPCSVAGLTIPLSWAASEWASHVQQSWAPDTFFWMCMSGAGAYVGTMATLLWITVTTWSDHHRRVRWIPGTTLGRRWVREDERLFFDKIAQAWGYKDVFKHGEESGEEWEALRETLVTRWLQLDRSSLLPGML